MPPSQNISETPSSSKILLLGTNQYCHVLDNNTGTVRLIEGPYRLVIESFETVIHVSRKNILTDGEYCTITNPYDMTTKCNRYGDIRVVKGPAIFSLFPEELLDGPHRNYLLEDDEYLLVKALKSFEIDGSKHIAGDLYHINGPIEYIPHKYEQIVARKKCIVLSEYQGIYITDTQTGTVKLVSGPTKYKMGVNESLYVKYYSDDEMKSMHIEKETSYAPALWLLENEACKIIMEDEFRIIYGPKTVLLKPYEQPYIMSISGGTPKTPNQLKIWKLRLGPDFCTDRFNVRTKDNAVLVMLIRYKWKFLTTDEYRAKIFSIKDFIGYATETMASLIRNIAAKYNFEEFHANTSEIIEKAVFDTDHAYTFTANGFQIFGIDIKEVTPNDPKIAAQLNDAIKSNMQVYVDKIQQEAKINSEKELVEAQIAIGQKKKALIELENENIKLKTIGAATIQREATIEAAKGQAEATKIIADADAAKENLLLKNQIELLGGQDNYLQLKKIETMGKIDRIILTPNDANVFIPEGLLQ